MFSNVPIPRKYIGATRAENLGWGTGAKSKNFLCLDHILALDVDISLILLRGLYVLRLCVGTYLINENRNNDKKYENNTFALILIYYAMVHGFYSCKSILMLQYFVPTGLALLVTRGAPPLSPPLVFSFQTCSNTRVQGRSQEDKSGVASSFHSLLALSLLFKNNLYL